MPCLSVGALVPRKGHDILLRALARLFDLEWRLTIVGTPTRDAPHARALLALAAELGIAERVTFAGEVDDAALAALWRQADLFALATHWEGYGMAVAEALKRGVPPVVTQVARQRIGYARKRCGVPGRRPGPAVQIAAATYLRHGAAPRHGRGGVAHRPDFARWPTQAQAFAAALVFAPAS